MRKIFYLLFTLILLLTMSSCSNNKLTKLKVAEVTHSVFYAPQYLAIELGYFEDEGLEIELINAGGADKVMSALLSNDIDIGFSGPEATIYVYNNGQTNYMINFCQLTKRDGSFIVSREKIDNFTIDMLKGKSILGGRAGGVPLMNLEYVLKEAGLTVGRDTEGFDVLVRTDIQFNAMAGAFVSGEGDFTTLFEPTALSLEKENKGYVVTSVGKYSKEVPFTSYYVTKDYLNKNKDILRKFTNAIKKAQDYLFNHTDLEVATIIQSQFSDIALNDLEEVVKRYREADVWCSSPYFSEEGFNRLMDIMEAANELDKRVDFNKIVTNEFVK